VTREAARDVAHATNSLVARGEDRVRARRFILLRGLAMWTEHIGLLVQDLFTSEGSAHSLAPLAYAVGRAAYD
jgi:hypothetical protein